MNATTPLTGRLLVALDGSRFSELAMSYVRALHSPTTETVLARVVPDSGAGGEVQAAVELEARLSLEHSAAAWGLDPDRTTLAVRAGDPASQLLDIASEHQCTLIVMASHGRGAVGRWRFGSVADRVSRESAIPVLIMRPEAGDRAPGIPATIERIIVPLDGSPLAETALPVASELGRQLGVPVRLVRVAVPTDMPLIPLARVDTGGMPVHPAVTADARGATEAAHIAEAWTYLEGVAKHPSLDDASTSLDVLAGDPASSLIDLAKPDDLVVLTSRGRSGMTRWLLGSVAQKLVQHADAPVCLVPNRRDRSPGA